VRTSLHQWRLRSDVYAFDRLVGDPLDAEATCLVDLAVQLSLGARKGKVLAYCLSVGQLEAVEGELIRRLGPGVAGEVEVFQCHARDGAKRERAEEAFKVDVEGAQIYLATKAVSRGNDANDVLRVIFLGMPTDMEEFVQQAGRCGRKQLGSVSVLASPKRLHFAFTLARKRSLMLRSYFASCTRCSSPVAAGTARIWTILGISYPCASRTLSCAVTIALLARGLPLLSSGLM
jgi:hypothetical protein